MMMMEDNSTAYEGRATKLLGRFVLSKSGNWSHDCFWNSLDLHIVPKYLHLRGTDKLT